MIIGLLCMATIRHAVTSPLKSRQTTRVDILQIETPRSRMGF